MTGSLEDTIATYFQDRKAKFPSSYKAEAFALVLTLRAAGVVPAEPATHDTPLRQAAHAVLDEWGDDEWIRPNFEAAIDRLRAAVAAVDGETPAT